MSRSQRAVSRPLHRPYRLCFCLSGVQKRRGINCPVAIRRGEGAQRKQCRDTSNEIWIWPYLGKGRNGAEATLVCWGPESSDTCPFRTQESQPEVPGDGGTEVEPCGHKSRTPGALWGRNGQLGSQPPCVQEPVCPSGLKSSPPSPATAPWVCRVQGQA